MVFTSTCDRDWTNFPIRPVFLPWIYRLVAYLASESCPATGKVFLVQGGKVQVFQPWTLTEMIDKNDRWTVSELQSEMKQLLG